MHNTLSGEEKMKVMNTMLLAMPAGNEPKVGIFWIDKENLPFEVHSVPVSQGFQTTDNLITIGILHKNVWKEEYNDRKYHHKEIGIYAAPYSDIRRGRIFFNKTKNQYEIMTGSWVTDEILAEIIRKFNLPKNSVNIIDEHWEIGHGYSDEYLN